MRLRIFFALCLFSTVLSAGFYKWVDENGAVHYSDHPVEQAEELKVPGTADRPNQAASDKADPDQAAGQSEEAAFEDLQPGEYALFEIVEPEENQTLRSDKGEVRVGMMLQPALQEGDKITLSVDGTPLKSPNISTQLILHDVPRGSHTLQATVVDADGQTRISAPVVNFHMRKAALKKDAP